MAQKKMLLSPSVFAADLARLPEQIRALEDAGADLLHVERHLAQGLHVIGVEEGAALVGQFG